MAAGTLVERAPLAYQPNTAHKAFDASGDAFDAIGQ
jgi:hypothetical protein